MTTRPLFWIALALVLWYLQGIAFAGETSPEASAAIARAERNVATAAALDGACWTPRECIITGQMLAAAADEAATAVALATPTEPRDADPWHVPAEPFADMTIAPTAAEVEDMVVEGIVAGAVAAVAEALNGSVQ